MFSKVAQLFFVAHKYCSGRLKVILSHSPQGKLEQSSSRTRREAKSLTKIKGLRTFLRSNPIGGRTPTLITGLLLSRADGVKEPHRKPYPTGGVFVLREIRIKETGLKQGWF